MKAVDSVRDRVTLLLLGMVLLVTVVAAAGAIGVTSLTDDVDVLVDDLRPSAYSNIALRNDMSRAQSDARGWALSGDRDYLTRYHEAVVDARGELAMLESMMPGNDPLTRSVQKEGDAAEAWLSFADGLVRREPGPVDPAYLLDGQVAFDEFTDLNDALSHEVDAEIDARGAVARSRAHQVILFVALASILGVAVTALLGRAVVRRVSGPLRDMETAVERLAAGDLAARVSTDGPREIGRVASALNTLAEENQRSREMEERVVSQLRQLDRAKDDFVSTVSHELRTPLTSIAGYMELLEDGFAPELTPQQKGMLSVVKRNVDRLRSLIEDLLTLSQVESDAFRTSFDVLDLSHLTSDVAHDVAEIAARAHVSVREANPGHPVLVCGDSGQLSRALLNLVTNAIKFSQPGGHVLIRLTEADGRAVVSVVDHGIGIPAGELPTLGTRFFRGSNAVEAEITGTGLGLRIVQTIADNHGGRLEIESTEGEGTTVRFVIPVAARQTWNIRDQVEITQG
ncbi:MAG TPA: ATP-binding protein [Nocardioidaceae bacterium]|nr:ATP-binding protein [Nocardioidaceae bacterium]